LPDEELGLWWASAAVEVVGLMFASRPTVNLAVPEVTEAAFGKVTKESDD
jgi:hypothetical protein